MQKRVRFQIFRRAQRMRPLEKTRRTDGEDILFEEQASYDPRAWMAQVVAPILYVHGASDKAVPLHVPDEMARLTMSKIVTIDGAGHLAQQERPVEVAAAIRSFVAAALS